MQDHHPDDFLSPNAEQVLAATHQDPVAHIEAAIRQGFPGAIVAWASKDESEERARRLVAHSPAAAREFGNDASLLAAYLRAAAIPQHADAMACMASPDTAPTRVRSEATRFHASLAAHRAACREKPLTLDAIEFWLSRPATADAASALLANRDLRVLAGELVEFGGEQGTVEAVTERLRTLRTYGAAAVRPPAPAPAPAPAPRQAQAVVAAPSRHTTANVASPRATLGWRRFEHLAEVEGTAPAWLTDLLSRFTDDELTAHFLREDPIARSTFDRAGILQVLAATRRQVMA